MCLGSGCIVKMGFSVGFESMGVVFLELIMEGGCLCCYSALLPHFSCLLKMGLYVCSFVSCKCRYVLGSGSIVKLL